MSALIAQYFLNHRLEPAEITRQMEEFARAGYEGVYAHARAGLLTPFMSEAWWRAIDTIVESCRKLGLEFWIWDEDYFPSGTAGGRVVWDDPGLISRGLEFSVTEVDGAGPFEVDFPPGMLLRCQAVERRPDGTAQAVSDITKFCGTRRQQWTARTIHHGAYSPLVSPVGQPHWRCSMDENRFAVRWEPERPGRFLVVATLVVPHQGVHPDILRREGVAKFLDFCYRPYAERYGSEMGLTIRGAFTDEPSPGHALYPWTAAFPEEFRKDHGYNILDNLHHLGATVGEESAAVRHHYRLTQHRLQREHYLVQIGRWCRRNKIAFTGHLTRTEWLSLVSGWWPNELRLYREMDIPCADPLGAAGAWTAAAPYHTGLKVVSSAAHLFGKKQAGSDCLAVLGDEAPLRLLKHHLDYQMALGINFFAAHGFSYSLDGPRKDEVPPSLFYQHTEWKHMRALTDHVRATCAELTGGTHECSIAVLYPSTSLACAIVPSANWTNQADEASVHALAELLLANHCDFDFIDEATLQESTDAEGKLRLPEEYRTIILPYLRYVDERTAERLLLFAKAGGTVIAVGGKPAAIPRRPAPPSTEWMDSSIRFRDSADRELLAGLPAVDVQGEGSSDVFVLRRVKNRCPVTFLFNRRAAEFSGTLDGVPVRIPPGGSLLLKRGQPSTFDIPAGESVDISGGWDVSFEPNHVPLNFWHPCVSEDYTPFGFPGFDLMSRQVLDAGPDPVRYHCRFMLTGAVPDAVLLAEESTFGGAWAVRVNGTPVTGWKPARLTDCKNQAAPVGALLRGGTTPTLNVITVEASGPGRGLFEVPYLMGSFAAEYRYAHLSIPFLTGGTGKLRMETLQSWTVSGYPTFSGSAVYQRSFVAPADGEYALDLGRVEDVAVVAVDGGAPVTLAWPPYRCRLGRLAAGEHTVRVEITNCPANRNHAAGLPAGLLGPVRFTRDSAG